MAVQGQHIDWSEREDADTRRIAAAQLAIGARTVARALRAYEDAPAGTGREARMALAIQAVTRKAAAAPAP